MNWIRKVNPKIIQSQLVRGVDQIDKAINMELSFHPPHMTTEEETEASQNLSLSTTLPMALWDAVSLLEDALETRSVPLAKQKLFAAACKALLGRSRMSLKSGANLFALWRKNKPFCLIAVDSADWPEKTVGGKEKFQVGSFMVHNTLGDVPLDGIIKNIEVAEHLLKHSSVRGIDKVLYGEVFVVDKLKKATTMAWYDVVKDKVSVRDVPQYNITVTENLVHELGHRYWNKFASGKDKRAWSDFYYEIGRNAPPPRIGVGAKFMSGNQTLTIKSIDIDKVFVEESTNPKEYFRVMDVIRALGKQGTFTQYPTPYASVDFEEFFCESLRLYALDRLKEPFKERFETVFCS